MNTKTQTGVALGSYPLGQIDLRAPLRDSMTLDGACFLDADTAADPQALALLRERLFDVRSAVMEAMHGEAFQAQLLALAKFLRGTHFGESALFQKTPTLRLYMPGALGTSWHSDHWYGHHAHTRTFWLPLTPVPAGAGVSFISAAGFTPQLEARLLSGEIGLRDINNLCSELGEEWLCAPGEYLTFSGQTLHGSVGNHAKALRCSIDFRGCASTAELGTKPLNNYRLVTAEGAHEAAQNYTGVRAVKYVCGAGGVSTKYQHILTEAYAHENAISIVRNEAEIEALSSLPVLSAYLKRQAPAASDYSAVLMHSLNGLPVQRTARLGLLRACVKHQVSLHFVLEDKVFPGTVTVEECLRDCIDEPARAITQPAV